MKTGNQKIGVKIQKAGAAHIRDCCKHEYMLLVSALNEAGTAAPRQLADGVGEISCYLIRRDRIFYAK